MDSIVKEISNEFKDKVLATKPDSPERIKIVNEMFAAMKAKGREIDKQILEDTEKDEHESSGR
jgi:hypothetical protein